MSRAACQWHADGVAMRNDAAMMGRRWRTSRRATMASPVATGEGGVSEAERDDGRQSASHTAPRRAREPCRWHPHPFPNMCKAV